VAEDYYTNDYGNVHLTTKTNWWDPAFRCPFCLAKLEPEYILTASFRSIFVKSISKFCGKHLEQAIKTLEGTVNRCEDVVLQMRAKKYLELVKVEQVCRKIDG
jgi:hypothetical protein